MVQIGPGSHRCKYVDNVCASAELISELILVCRGNTVLHSLLIYGRSKEGFWSLSLFEGMALLLRRKPFSESILTNGQLDICINFLCNIQTFWTAQLFWKITFWSFFLIQRGANSQVFMSGKNRLALVDWKQSRGVGYPKLVYQ